MLSEMAFHAADAHRANSEGATLKGRLKERCGLEPRSNFFFRLRNRQKLVRISFENTRYISFRRYECPVHWIVLPNELMDTDYLERLSLSSFSGFSLSVQVFFEM